MTDTAPTHSASSSLENQTIVVSGAGGGIGLAATRSLALAGANVVALDLGGGGLDEARSIEGVHVVEGDVTSSADWESARDLALERFGAVHGLINNAGIEGAVAPLIEYPEEMFDRVLAVNAKGVWLGMKTIAPAIAEAGGGAIVNVSSVAGLGGANNLSAYSASKHAVIGLTKTAALELAPSGIRVNAVCPSPIDTRMMRSLEDGMKNDDLDAATIQAVIASTIPLGRYGTPTEVADLMLFLLSEESRFISGTAIPIDGAMNAR